MDDLISRQAALRTDSFGDGHEGLRAFHSYHDYRLMREYLESLPPIEPERKKSKWIPVTNGRGGFECENCHCYAPSYQNGVEWLSDYCPSCGAEMIFLKI